MTSDVAWPGRLVDQAELRDDLTSPADTPEHRRAGDRGRRRCSVCQEAGVSACALRSRRPCPGHLLARDTRCAQIHRRSTRCVPRTAMNGREVWETPCRDEHPDRVGNAHVAEGRRLAIETDPASLAARVIAGAEHLDHHELEQNDDVKATWGIRISMRSYALRTCCGWRCARAAPCSTSSTEHMLAAIAGSASFLEAAGNELFHDAADEHGLTGEGYLAPTPPSRPTRSAAASSCGSPARLESVVAPDVGARACLRIGEGRIESHESHRRRLRGAPQSERSVSSHRALWRRLPRDAVRSRCAALPGRRRPQRPRPADRVGLGRVDRQRLRRAAL